MNKKNLILGGTLIVLIALAYIYQGPLKKWQNSLGEPSNFFAKIDIEELSKIEVTQNGMVTTLDKTDERFKINGTKDFYVKDDLYKSIISNLEEAKSAGFELVSTNKDKKGEFQTNENGVQVKIYQDDEVVLDMIVGKYGSDFSSTYVSKSDIGETYLVKANLTSLFNQPEWRDTTIFSTDKEMISKIRFQYPERQFTIEKIDGEWKGTEPYGFLVDGEKVDNITSLMSSLTASKIPEQSFEGTGLEDHSIIIQVTGEGIDNTIMIGGDNGADQYYSKRGDSDNIYLISSGQRDELDKQIWEIK